MERKYFIKLLSIPLIFPSLSNEFLPKTQNIDTKTVVLSKKLNFLKGKPISEISEICLISKRDKSFKISSALYNNTFEIPYRETIYRYASFFSELTLKYQKVIHLNSKRQKTSFFEIEAQNNGIVFKNTVKADKKEILLLFKKISKITSAKKILPEKEELHILLKRNAIYNFLNFFKGKKNFKAKNNKKISCNPFFADNIEHKNGFFILKFPYKKEGNKLFVSEKSVIFSKNNIESLSTIHNSEEKILFFDRENFKLKDFNISGLFLEIKGYELI